MATKTMTCLKAFTWAHEARFVRSHAEGEVFEAEEDLVDVAIEKGWAELLAAPKTTKPAPAAPTDLSKMNKAQLLAMAKEKGVVVPEGATNKEIAALLAVPPAEGAGGAQ
jgi:RES domain-containing protein